jgi:hypothetical protein
MVNTNIRQGMVNDENAVHEDGAVLVSGSFVETIAGIGAVVLAVLGLVGMLPEVLLAVAVIAIGAAFVVESRSIVSRFHVVARNASDIGMDELAVRMTTEFVAGVAGLVLGVVALLGVAPAMILLPIAAIVFGLTLLFGVGVHSRLSELETECGTTHEVTRKIAREAISAGSGVPMLLGVGAIALGILSLVGIAMSMVLTLTAVLAIGGGMFFSGAAMTAGMLGFTQTCEQHEHTANA